MSKIAIDTSALHSPPFRNNTGKLVWFCLLRDADENGVADTSARSIAKEIGISEKTVRNLLSEFELHDVIECASPIFGPHLSSQQIRYLGKHIILKNTTTCESKPKAKSKPKSAPKSDIQSDIITTDSLSDTLCFVNPEYREAFSEWLDFKKRQFKFEYKTRRSLNAAYNELLKLSEGNPQTAMEIVMQSESNGWKGLYKLKYNETKPITSTAGAGRNRPLAPKTDRYSMLERAAGEILRNAAYRDSAQND